LVAAASEHFVQGKIVKKLWNKYFLDLDDGKNNLPESTFLLFDLFVHIETHTRCLGRIPANREIECCTRKASRNSG
jgi:hypothetical protein